jgi:pimeloyl-ACP methyl ester carboxylesterase
MPEIAFIEKGTENPLVLLHGFGETKEIWKNFMEPLSKTNRVICPDLPGFGGSTLPKEAFTLKDIAKLIENWLWEMNVRNPIIIGHSLGGYITLGLMTSEKIQMPGLGLFHSSAFGDNEAKKEVRDKTIQFIDKNGVDPFIRSFVPPLFGPENRLKCKDNIESLIT